MRLTARAGGADWPCPRRSAMRVLSFTPIVFLALLAACRSTPPEPVAPGEPAPGGFTAAMPVIPARPAEQPAAPAPAAGATDARAERLAALKKEHEDAQNAYYDLFRNAKTDAEMEAIAKTAKAPDTEPFARRARELIAEDATDVAAFDTLCWMVKSAIPVEAGAKEPMTGSLALLERHHLQRAELADLAPTLGYSDEPAARAFLAKLGEASPHAEVRGKALFALAQVVKGQRETAIEVQRMGAEGARTAYGQWMPAERIDELLKADPGALEAETIALYERVQKDYGDVRTMPGTAYESTLGADAGSALFELRNLAIG